MKRSFSATRRTESSDIVVGRGHDCEGGRDSLKGQSMDKWLALDSFNVTQFNTREEENTYLYANVNDIITTILLNEEEEEEEKEEKIREEKSREENTERRVNEKKRKEGQEI